jgi:hypothetical protein
VESKPEPTAGELLIFICYRREDSAGHAGRLYDELARRFSPEQLFFDVNTILPGVDFAETIRSAVGRSAAVLIVIGPRWLSATDERGTRRLDDPADYVRVEIESALARDTLVVPVLVQDADMPRARDLPEAIRPLATRNAVQLRDAAWRADFEMLATSLERIAPVHAADRAAAPRRRILDRVKRRWALAGVGAATVVLLGIGAISGQLGPGRPSGDRIVFSRQVADPDSSPCGSGSFDGRMYVVDPDHPKLPPYRFAERTNLLERNPTWSPKASAIVFSGIVQVGHSPSALFSIPLGGAPLRKIADGLGTRDAFALAVDPTGSFVVHRENDALWRTSIVGGTPTFIGGLAPPSDSNAPPGESVEDLRDFAFRADGTLLVIVLPLLEGQPRLESWDITAGSREPLDFDFGGGVPAELAVASDGNTLVVRMETETDSYLALGHIDRNGADLKALDVGVDGAAEAAFSSDGSRIAFAAGPAGSEQIWEYDIASRTAAQVTRLVGAAGCSPTWGRAEAGLAGPRAEPSPGALRPLEIGPLTAGPYVLDVTKPPMQLVFREGWAVRRYYVDGWSVWRPDAGGEVDYGNVRVVYDGPCGDEGTHQIQPRTIDLVTWLQERNDLVVADPIPVNYGGYSGVQVDVSGRSGKGCDQGFPHWGLFNVAADSVSVAEGEHLRLIALDVRDDLVTLMVFVDGDIMESYWEQHVRPLLETLEFPAE